jgi:hypothetical protein
MQYRLVERDEQLIVEGRIDEKSCYIMYAWLNEYSRLIYNGEYSDDRRKEIKNFLKTQCIHIDEHGYAWFSVH